MAAGVMVTTAPAASTSVLERTTVMRPLPSSQRCTSSQVREEASERRSPASDRTATRATSNLPLSAACSGVSKPRPRRRGWTAVSRITASTSAVRAQTWRWDFANRRPHPFSEARTPRSLPGDSCPAHSCDLVMAEVARRMVAMLAPSPARTAR